MKALILLSSAVLLWCSEPSPAPDPHAPSCVSACANLQKHDCDEAKPTSDGATCVEVCQNAGTLPVACITNAESCDAAESCE